MRLTRTGQDKYPHRHHSNVGFHPTYVLRAFNYLMQNIFYYCLLLLYKHTLNRLEFVEFPFQLQGSGAYFLILLIFHHDFSLNKTLGSNQSDTTEKILLLLNFSYHNLSVHKYTITQASTYIIKLLSL